MSRDLYIFWIFLGWGIAVPSFIIVGYVWQISGRGAIHEQHLKSPSWKGLIISNKEINDITKIVEAVEDSNILLKGVTKTIKNERKEQKGGFLSMLLCTLGASLLGNLLAGKGIVRAGSGNKKGKGIVKASYGNEMDF